MYRKSLIILFVVMFPITILAIDSYIKGDVNNDGKVNSTDYIHNQAYFKANYINWGCFYKS